MYSTPLAHPPKTPSVFCVSKMGKSSKKSAPKVFFCRLLCFVPSSRIQPNPSLCNILCSLFVFRLILLRPLFRLQRKVRGFMPRLWLLATLPFANLNISFSFPVLVKREAEAEVEKQVSAKRQKRDEVAQKKAMVLKNRKESSSEDSSSDSEEEVKVPPCLPSLFSFFHIFGHVSLLYAVFSLVFRIMRKRLLYHQNHNFLRMAL